ncbi:MAG: hypothetical protein KAV82_08415 [Phycisphaerae bacterium]|nr:hypothetical protein [Phycisphaerae bacterium]
MEETSTIQPELENRQTSNGAFWDEQPPGAWWSWWHVPELVAVFVTGVAVMTFLYGAGEGAPGCDSFYHIKMSVLLPRIGLIDKFKWLTTTIFADQFVSHHWGFQTLMVPFVYGGKWLAGDYVTGAKWGITFYFSLSMVLFHLLLMIQRVRMRWLWLGLYLVMPAQFFGRHLFIRAIAPSLACMLLLMVLMFRRRYVWCAVVVALYIHVYLGAVFYVPVVVGAYFLMGFLGEDGDRVSWKLPAWAIVGMVIGLLTHPYRDGVFDFLRVQVLGSGLTPDIPVGREWKSYEGKLWNVVFVYFGFTLSMLVVSVVARLRMGERLNAREAAILVINFVFLVMAFRQRRFIEYWPPFALLSSAYLLAPLMDRLADRARESARRIGAVQLWSSALVPVGMFGLAGFLLLLSRSRWWGIDRFVAEWPVWAFVAGLVFLVPMSRVWRGEGSRAVLPAWLVSVANLFCGALMLSLVFGPILAMFDTSRLPAGRMHVPVWAWGVLGLAYLVLPTMAETRDQPESSGGYAAMIPAALTAIVTGGTFVLLLILGGAGQMVSVQRSSRCKYDLPEVRRAMAYLHENSREDAIIFTDDWDVFPLYFYHNHRNRYIVGLDPKFSHARDPVLWERYVKITQSRRFPVQATVELHDDQGRKRKEKIEVRLEDIRDYFGADFVITDPDHVKLARNLESAPELAQRVYPPEKRMGKHWPPFTIYRIKATGE